MADRFGKFSRKRLTSSSLRNEWNSSGGWSFVNGGSVEVRDDPTTITLHPGERVICQAVGGRTTHGVPRGKGLLVLTSQRLLEICLSELGIEDVPLTEEQEALTRELNIYDFNPYREKLLDWEDLPTPRLTEWGFGPDPPAELHHLKVPWITEVMVKSPDGKLVSSRSWKLLRCSDVSSATAATAFPEYLELTFQDQFWILSKDPEGTELVRRLRSSIATKAREKEK